MADSQNTFKCVIISPAGKLLECSAVSVRFIAHDGSVGVMSSHMPMLCQLGLGIMEIHPVEDARQLPPQYALIDGGFALVHSNIVNIIADDAVKGWDIKKEKYDVILDNNRHKLKGLSEKSPQYAHQLHKNSLLEKLPRYQGS